MGFYEILFESEYLSKVRRFYGWSDEIAVKSLGSMAQSLETRQDWRVDNMLLKSRQHGLEIDGRGLALEVGFGTGSLTTVAGMRGINIVGIDYTADYLHVARQLGATAGFSDDRIAAMFSRGNVEDLQFPNGHFALIVSSGVMQFINDPISAMKEMLRTLSPGGILLLDAPDYRFPFEAQYNIPWIPFLKRELAKAWLGGFEKPCRGLDYVRYVSLPHCLGIMKAVGFEILEARTTSPEAAIPGQLERILGAEASKKYLLNSPEDVFRLAQEVNRRNVNVAGTSFLITARRPVGEVLPG